MSKERWLEKAGEVSAAMAEAGFTSVFEHMSPNAYGRNTVYTLWIEMGKGLEVLSIVNGNGAASVYRLTPISGAALKAAVNGNAQETSARYVRRDYWGGSGDHYPYVRMVHDANDEKLFQLYDLKELLDCVEDGEEFEIIIRPTGRRPFGERRYRYQEPHTYGPETDEQMAERLSAKDSAPST